VRSFVFQFGLELCLDESLMTLGVILFVN